jgi:ribosomal-protein-alanine N-acetyltransferase
MTQPVLESVYLEGARVALRPVRSDDVEAAFAALDGRREILDWLVWGGPERARDLLPYYSHWRRGDDVRERALDGARDYALAVIDLADGRFSGCLSLRFTAHPGAGDLGYWIAVERWGRGFASEAIKLSAWLAFGPLRAHLLCASVFHGNQASRRVLEKNGFSLDHEGSVLVDGTRRPQWSLNATRRSFLESAAVAWRPAVARVEFRAAAAGAAG